MHQLWILIYQQKLPLNRYQGSLQWGPQGVRVRLSSAAFHYDKMSKKSSSVIDDGTERNLSMVWSVTEENRYYNWTLVYFFLFFIKEWILIQIFHVYNSCLADFPTYFNVFTFFPLEIEIYRYVHHLKISAKNIFTSKK